MVYNQRRGGRGEGWLGWRWGDSHWRAQQGKAGIGAGGRADGGQQARASWVGPGHQAEGC